jgi:hypothetical protein
MFLARFLFGVLVCVCSVALGRADQEALSLLTAHGSSEKIREDALTLKLPGPDGKFVRSLALKFTGTSRFAALTTHKRAGKLVIGQKELQPEDLKQGQGIAVIYTTGSSDNILLVAVVQPGPERELAATLPPGVPAKVATVLQYIDEHNVAPPGYEGGRIFLNLGRDREQVLPRKDAHLKAITYHEWDVNPKVPGKNRGPERLVTGSDGSAYYTADHYRTFIKIR